MKLYENIFFDGCVGLGDAIVMNAIVHKYARNCDKLYYPSSPQFVDTLTCLYQDYPNIEVWRFYNPLQEEIFVETNHLFRVRSTGLITSEIHRIGCEPERIQVHWPQQLYENFDVPFKERYLGFKMPKHIEGCEELYQTLTQGDDDYVLVHRYASDHPTGIPIDIPGFRAQKGLPPKKIIEIQEGQTTNMLQYKTLIERANEIHCIPSSFFNLVDSMITDIPAVAFFHDIRKNSLMKVNSNWNNHRWDIITYGIRV